MPINLVPGSGAVAVDKIVLDDHRPLGSKCWFRLAACGSQRTVDKFGSSYFAASDLRGFERHNRLRLWWWTRKDEPQ